MQVLDFGDEGYPSEWFVSENEEYTCAICRNVLREAMQAIVVVDGEDRCGHHFCKACITAWLEVKSSCPLCVNAISMSDVHPDVSVRRKLASFEVRCHVDPSRCDAKGKLGKVGQEWWQKHHRECLVKTSVCTGCKQRVQKESMPTHLLACPSLLIGCPHSCGFKGQRKELKQHDCSRGPNSLVPCKFSRVGCKACFRRGEPAKAAAHMTQAMAEHLELLLQHLQPDQPPEHIKLVTWLALPEPGADADSGSFDGFEGGKLTVQIQGFDTPNQYGLAIISDVVCHWDFDLIVRRADGEVIVQETDCGKEEEQMFCCFGWFRQSDYLFGNEPSHSLVQVEVDLRKKI